MFRRLAAAWKPRWKSSTSHKICKHLRHHCAALERLVEMGLSPQASIPDVFLSDGCGSAKSHQALWQLPSWNWGSQGGSSPLGQLACQRGRVLRKNPLVTCVFPSLNCTFMCSWHFFLQAKMLGIISSISMMFLLSSIHFMTTNHVKICHTFPGRHHFPIFSPRTAGPRWRPRRRKPSALASPSSTCLGMSLNEGLD